MTGRNAEPPRATHVERAVALVSEALDLLDAYGGPADATAHLDLALRRLREEAVLGGK